MNVLQLISPTGFYGAERWILALATHLPGLGLRCDLAMTSESPETRFELLERYPKCAGKTYRLELHNRFDIRVISALAQLVRDQNVDVVHSHGYKSDILAALVSWRTGTASVTTPHGYTKAHRVKDRVYEALGKRALREFDRVVPLSRELERNVLAAGVDPARVRLIGNSVELNEINAAIERADARKMKLSAIRSTLPRSGRRLGYVGQLVPRKRVHLLVELFDALWRLDPSTTLDIAGDGPSRAALESQVAALPGVESVRFHGYVEDRLTLMLDLDMFVMASDAEGVPRVMMEAMALGLPCAAYSIDGITDLIDHEKTGMLAADGDARALVHHCERVLTEPALAARLRSFARERIERRHSAESMAEAYRALYEELLDERGTALA